jgi:hypothetical protein
MNSARENRRRAARCCQALRRYDGDGSPYTGLVDLLADAMHWCRLKDHDFHGLLDLAGQHYAAEVLDETPAADRMINPTMEKGTSL